MCLILSFPTVDPLHEDVSYGYVAWMSGWTCNKPNSCHPYFWNIPFLICSSNIGTGLFRFETLMFCQYLERKSWPRIPEVKGVITIGPLVRHQCMVVPSHVGYLDIPLSQSLNLKRILHVNISFFCSLLPCLWSGFPQDAPHSCLYPESYLQINHQRNLRVYHCRLFLTSPQFLCFLTIVRGIEHRGWWALSKCSTELSPAPSFPWICETE